MCGVPDAATVVTSSTPWSGLVAQRSDLLKSFVQRVVGTVVIYCSD